MGATDSLVVLLSSFDAAGAHHLGITVAYVLRSADPQRVQLDVQGLKLAAERVVEKWRLLAGRLESNGEGFYHVRVPLGELKANYARLAFTTSTLDSPLTPPIPSLRPDSAVLYDRPAVQLFRHAYTPQDMKTYAKNAAPLLAIHVTHLENCSCVGFTVPHGVFDGVGMAKVLHAVSAEMAGQKWAVPPMSGVNVVDRALDTVRNLQDVHPPDPQFKRHLEEDVAPLGVASVAALGRNLLYERVWQRSEHHSIYFGADWCAQMLSACQRELDAQGRADVRLGVPDVLLAWFIKNAYIDDAPTNLPVLLNGITNFRPYLQSLEPSLAGSSYPHNLIFVLRQLTSSVAELQRTPLAAVAAQLRRATEAHRGIGYVRLGDEFLRERAGGSAMFRRTTTSDAWVHTNQSIARSDRMDWGANTEVLGLWHFLTPMVPEKGMSMHCFNGGFVLDGRARRGHWRSLGRELERMKGVQRVYARL